MTSLVNVSLALSKLIFICAILNQQLQYLPQGPKTELSLGARHSKGNDGIG